MFCEIIFAGCVKYPIFNLPLQYRITKNRSRLLRTEPPAYLLRPGVHLFQRHLRRTITKSVYIAIISRLVGYFLNNYAFHILVLIMYSKFAIPPGTPNGRRQKTGLNSLLSGSTFRPRWVQNALLFYPVVLMQIAWLINTFLKRPRPLRTFRG